MRMAVSRPAALVVILVWLGLAVAGVTILPLPSGELREMFAFSQVLPILLGAFYFGQTGGLATALAASLISGTLVIHHRADIDSLFVQRLMFQIIAFNCVALLTSFLCGQEKLRHKQLRQQLDRINALRAIDTAITAGAGLDTTLRILLEGLRRPLGVQAAAVLLRHPVTGALDVRADFGFTEDDPPQDRKDRTLQAAREQRTVYVADLAETHPAIARQIPGTGALTFHALPLVAQGDLLGVLEVYDRTTAGDDERQSDWTSYLETLASQAALSLSHARLLENLQQTNAELFQAYEATLRGWSHALELRDRETEGHSRRVVTVAMLLAKRMGLRGERLQHFQRGAILHDIGKLGVPDNILHKPGPLDDREWAVMRQHPVYAKDLLTPIPYLRPALPIPYAHHEHWDGSGYPLGLRGRDIPQEARIFAVVDVWDALRSDRPYRKALSEQDCLQQLQREAGTTLDPEVVARFLTLVHEVPLPV